MQDPARLLDANANRAREALRVMEDCARLALSHAPLAERLKHLRHDLTAALAGVDPLRLLAARDAASDVGAAISAEGEYQRSGLRHVAAAAGSRLTEALRVIEEAAKAMMLPAVAGTVEAARYRAYDAHRDLLLAFGAGMPAQYRLCVLLTEAACAGRGWAEVARAAIEGGADCLQLREKGMDDGELLRRAGALVELARPRGVAVFVNDKPHVALLAGADGTHVGQTDLPLREVRRLAGGALRVGVSTGTIEQARAAAFGGADLCGVGPMFPTTTKHKPMLAGPGFLRDYLADPATARVPHLAIGGITPANVADLAAAGCRGVAVSAAVCAAPDPAGACRAIRAAMGA